MADGDKKDKNKSSLVYVPAVTYLVTQSWTLLKTLVVSFFCCLLLEILVWLFNLEKGASRALEVYYIQVGQVMSSNVASVVPGAIQSMYSTLSLLLSDQLANAITSSGQLFEGQELLDAAKARSWIGIGVDWLTAFQMIIVLSALSWAMKAFILLAYIPIYLLFSIVFFVDGYCQRKIDTYRGVSVSEDIFMAYYRAAKSLLFGVFFLYLAIPHAWPAGYVLLPSAVAFAFVTRQSIKSFKKYL